MTVVCDGGNLATCSFLKFKIQKGKCRTFLRPVYREPICVSVRTSHIELIRYDNTNRADRRCKNGEIEDEQYVYNKFTRGREKLSEFMSSKRKHFTRLHHIQKLFWFEIVKN